MGVAGAAIATITSQLFSACMVVYALIHTDDMYKLVWSKVRIDERMLRRIVRIGIPAGMQSVMYNISNIIIQAGVNTLGTDNVTAWATYGKVDGLYWMMINALGISVTTFGTELWCRPHRPCSKGSRSMYGHWNDHDSHCIHFTIFKGISAY